MAKFVDKTRTGIAEDNPAKTQARQDREGYLIAENQHLAAADVLDADGLPGRVKDGDQRSQRIELIAAHVVGARDAAREEALIEGQVSGGAGGQVGADAESHALRGDPGSPGRTLQKGIEVARVCDTF